MKLSRKLVALFAFGAIALSRLAAAQESDPRKAGVVTRPAASPNGAGVVLALPSPPPLDNAPRQATMAGPGPARGRDSAGTSALKGVQAREIKSGQARLALASGLRTVRPGDLIGTDVVRSIEPGRILLTRSSPNGGEATVVVSFDDAGRGRVRVLFASDPTAVAPPPVR
jgi:hypothetical protein